MPGDRLFIANLSFNTGWKELRDHCAHHVKIVYVHMLIDPKTGKSAGRAVVELADGRDLEMAIRTLHDTDLDGRDILVREDHGRSWLGGKDGGKSGKDEGGRNCQRTYGDSWDDRRGHWGPLPGELLADGRA